MTASSLVKGVVYSAIVAGLMQIIFWSLNTEVMEHLHPTPAEWRYLTRHNLRCALSEYQKEIVISRGYTRWIKAGKLFNKVIAELEDPAKEGHGLLRQKDSTGTPIEISQLGLAGPDVSSKSWQWVQGYYEALMGAALASESTDDMVKDVSRDLYFPKSTVIGPSNPDPRPVTKKMKAAPLEENCERPFASPETYYMKILTGNGFTTRQKVIAAIAYGKWLEYSGLNDSAYEMFKWSVDIAKQPLQDSDKLLKTGSFILEQNEAVRPTSNLVHAITAMGVHQARMGNVQTALPILLSAFKARREAPVGALVRSAAIPMVPRGFVDCFAMVLQAPPELAQPPSGNEPLSRAVSANCEDSELMMYIGELMYASTSRQEEGLIWTKQAAEIASREANSLSMPVFSRLQLQAEMRKCSQCLLTSVRNWSFMSEDLLERGQQAAKSSWFGQRPAQSTSTTDADHERLATLQPQLARLKLDADVEKMVRSSRFAMGE